MYYSFYKRWNWPKYFGLTDLLLDCFYYFIQIYNEGKFILVKWKFYSSSDFSIELLGPFMILHSK